MVLNRSNAIRAAGLLAALAIAGCFGDSTGPRGVRGALAFQPVFRIAATAGQTVVSYTGVRVLLTRPGTSTTVLDTAVAFPSTADSVRLPLSILLDAGVSSEDLDLRLALFDAAGDTVFRGGPVRVTVTAGATGTRAPDVPLFYVGIGANAMGVRFTTTPALAFYGDTASFVAVAYDSSNNPIPGTPIIYAVNPLDSTTAAVPSEAAGKVVAKAHRGTARVTATLLTGQAATATLTVQPKAAAVGVVSGKGQSGPVGAALPQPITVRVKGADSLGVAGVTVNFAVATGGGSLTAPSAVTDTGGYASVGWTLGALAGAQSITATVSGVTPATITATGQVTSSISLSVPGGLVGVGAGGFLIVKLSPAAPAGGVTVTLTSDSTQYLTVPGTVSFAAGDTTKVVGLAGVAAGISVVHATAPGYGAGTTAVAVVPNFIVLQVPFGLGVGQSASFSIQLIPAAPSAGFVVTLLSSDTTKVKVTTPTVSFAAGQSLGSGTVQGVAPGAAAVTAVATGYAIGATVVTVSTAGPAKTLALISGGNQSGTPGTQLAAPVVVRVADSLGLAVSGFPVTFAVATGGGSVGTPSTTTDVNGLATTTWTLGAAAGQQTITATASGLVNSPLTVTANPNGVIASTTVTPHLDTLTALTATVQLAAQAKDAGNNNLAGSFTWTSRTPAVATVSPAGLVTAVTNGSTYVVAVEAGGTQDSALIVVQQKLASINVTPSGKNIYLGASYAFTASGVDGLGKPIASGLTFTWSTTAPAVASVDAAGNVAGLWIGTAQIKATSGAVTGIANVNIITQITKLVVVVDSTGATKSDTASLPSLGVLRRYRALAYDTLNNLMALPDTSYHWVSSNPSVAALPNVTSDTISAASVANGNTTIKATAQGFVSAPGALLTVAQVLASIQLTPAAVTVGPNGGTVALTARGLDANGHFISGGTFTYTATNPAIATVGASTGVVAGVVVGADSVTATSGAITSNYAVVTVSNAVPPVISFGRDTLSVGRGGNTSIPVLLSRANASPVIVKLMVKDTFAYWSTAAVTIPANQTSVNATLNGHNAGTTLAYATDSSGTGYAGDTVTVKVTANMSLASGSFSLNATDVANSQVLLSDPSPAGGTYVTFSYGTPGVAAVSPDPAFIPAGQLAANIQVKGLAAGTTTITPVATGVNGAAANVTVYAAILKFNTGYPTGTTILGLGQYQPNEYVYFQAYTNLGVPVTLTSLDTTLVTVTPSVMIATGTNYQYFTFSAVGLGSTTITPSATGWTSGSTLTVTSTTPHVGISGGTTIYTTSGIQGIAVYAEDSTLTTHPRINSLIVHLASSDTTVMKVLDSIVTIPPNANALGGVRVTPGALGGTAWIYATAGGHTPDSTQWTVLGPPLHFYYTSNVLGQGQQDNNNFVYTPNNELTPLVVHLTSSDSTKVSVPDSVIIPAGTNYLYLTILGLAPGTVTIGASATGYQSTSATYTVSTPMVTAYGSGTYNNFQAPFGITVYSTDSLRNAHPRSTPDTITVTSLNPSKATVDSGTVIIPAGTYLSSARRVTPVDTGIAKIVFTAAGQLTPDTLTITIQEPTIRFYYTTYMIGRRQHLDPNGSGFEIYTPNSRSVPVPATLTQKQPSVDSLGTASPTIPASLNYLYDDFYGLATGKDTITLSATDYLPTVAYLTVTTPRFTSSGLPGTVATTNPPMGITIYAADSLGNGHYTMDTVVVHAVSSDTTVLRPDSAYYHIPKNNIDASGKVQVTGPGTAYIVYSDTAASGYRPDTTNTVTVTGPALHFSVTSTMLGMRQTSGASGYYVYTPNNVATPLVVHLVSTDTSVATVPDSVIVPTNSNIAYFGVTGRDTVGTIQIQGTATGYAATSMNVQVTPARFAINTATQLNTTSGRAGLSVVAEDQNGTSHYTAENVVVTLASSAPGVANIDSATVTILAGNAASSAATWGPNPNQATPGTAQLSATDVRAALYAYQQGTVNVAVVTPTLGLGWGTQTLGIGQYNSQYAYSPNNAVSPITVSLAHTGTARTSITQNGSPVSSVVIPAASNIVYFHVVGTAVGWDTLGASAASPPFNPATAYTAVSQGHVDPIAGWPSALSVGGADSALITLYARDSTQNIHYVEDSTTITLAPNANIQFVSGGASSHVITSVVIPKDAQSVQFYVKAVSAGTGSAQLTATNYVTYNTPTITVSP